MAQADAVSYRGDTRQPYELFAFIWAVSTLIHQLAFTFWVQTWDGWLVTYCAFLVIWEPRCLGRFGALVLTSLLHLFVKLPFVPNHILFEGMMNLTLLIGLGWTVWHYWDQLHVDLRKTLRRFIPFGIAVIAKILFIALPGHNHVFGGLTSIALLYTLGRAFEHPPVTLPNKAFFASTIPVMRMEIVLMYCWAAVQKMNWDYVNPEVSCAAELHQEIIQYFPFLPGWEWELSFVSWASIAIELAIPALLLFRRTRFAGFVMAIAFHLWLSIHHAAGIFSFSALILSMLIFFMPTETAEQLGTNWRRALDRLGKIGKFSGEQWVRYGLMVIFMVTVITQTSLYLIISRSYDTFWIANRVGFWMWVIWGVWLGTHYLKALWQTREKSRKLPNYLVWTPALIMLLPVIGNGLNPWIGLKTQTSFSMYSNLRSEGEGNHMFLKRIDIFSFQKDMVEIVSSEPNILVPGEKPTAIQQFANTGRILPYFELRRLISTMEGDLRVSYIRDGQMYTVARQDGKTSGDAHLFDPVPWYQHKILWFRRHESLTEPMHCTH